MTDDIETRKIIDFKLYPGQTRRFHNDPPASDTAKPSEIKAQCLKDVTVELAELSVQLRETEDDIEFVKKHLDDLHDKRNRIARKFNAAKTRLYELEK